MEPGQVHAVAEGEAIAFVQQVLAAEQVAVDGNPDPRVGAGELGPVDVRLQRQPHLMFDEKGGTLTGHSRV